MRPKTARIIGVILISAAILGWMISLGGFVATWTLRPAITRSLVAQVKIVKGTLEITVAGLDATQKSFGAIIGSMELLQSAVEKTAITIQGTTGYIDSLIEITDSGLKNTFDSIRGPLESAKKGAEIIDNALRTISDLPLIGPLLSESPYNPTTPLDKALEQVSSGLDNLPDTFNSMSESLSNTRDNIQSVEDGIANIANSIGEISANLEETRQALIDYQATAQSALDFLEKWGDNLPELITILAILLSLLFIWIAATQLGLYLQGTTYYRQGKE